MAANKGKEDGAYILYPGEAESMIQSLKLIPYEEYGLEQWFNHHGYVNSLNMQAVTSAQSKSDEFVKEYLINHDKISLLVNDLIMVELWKDRVFKRLIKNQFEPSASFPTYTILYHELLLTNLLETITFHSDAAESLGDSAVDLCDWCYRSLCYLVHHSSTEDAKTEFLKIRERVDMATNLEDLERQNRLIAFDKGMKAISLVRHLIEHSLGSNSVMPLGIARRLLQTHDVPLVLCQLIEQAPWIATGFDKERNRNCKFFWQENGTWASEFKPHPTMGKAEGQIWICLCQILLSNHSSFQYDSSIQHRRNALLRLRPHLTEIKLDVIPILGDLRRYLEQLSLGETTGSIGGYNSTTKTDTCLVELVPEIRESLNKKYQDKWNKLCDKFREQIESERCKQASQRAASKWTDMFSDENLQQVFASMGDITDQNDQVYKAPRCPVCGELAAKRCSRCRNEWYCRRECQVKHWPKHKKACDLLANENNNNHN